MTHTARTPSIFALFSLATIAGGCVNAPEFIPPPIVDQIASTYAYSSINPERVSNKNVSQWWLSLGGNELGHMTEQLMADNLELAQIRAQLDQVRARAAQAQGARLPSITGTGDTSLSRAQNPVTSNLDWSDKYSIGLITGWDTDIFGGLRSAQRAADLVTLASELAYLSAEQRQVAILSKNWVRAASLQRRIALGKTIAESFRTTYTLTDQRYRAGSALVTAIDVQITRQSFDAALADIPVLEAQLKTQLHQIDVQLGKLPGETLKSFIGNIDGNTLSTIPVGLPADLIAGRSDVAAAELRYRAALQDIGTARARLYPNLTLSASLLFQSSQPDCTL